ncbi:hypothetical protein ElyMa_003284200 [Elysia marginata]|uniref:Uncharacterized protein n=1 Tax=Elysia marginata TaxID=1093978 RepID=A0AAV4J994_9GAST|nr:hypothetical protein ElyMa_003284200 [Elysia marginata]
MQWSGDTLCNSGMMPLSARSAESCLLADKGPKRCPIRPSDQVTAWDFRARTRFCPLYHSLRFSVGRAMGPTVPSIKPKHRGRGEPIATTLSLRAETSNHGWSSRVRRR